MKQKQKALESPIAPVHGEEEASNLNTSSSEKEPRGRIKGIRRAPNNSNNFKVKIPEFEGKLDHNEFLECYTLLSKFFITRTFQMTRK